MTPARSIRLLLPAVLTAALAAGYLVGAAALDPALTATSGWWLPGALALAQAVAVLFRERRPIVVLAVVVALDLVALVATAGEIGTTVLGVAIAAYTVGRRVEGSRRGIVLGVVAVAEVAIVGLAGTRSDEIPAGWAIPFAALRVVLLVALPVVVAEVVTGRERLLAALRERAETAERDRELRARQAVQRERTAMARELHDVAAHHLTGIVVSAQAAASLVDREPARAREYLATLQQDARTTLDHLRQTVGLLRADGTGDLAPAPSLARLPALVAEAAAAGRDVRLEVTGDPAPAPLGPLADIAGYRMVQESLANAARHAPGSAVVVEVAHGATEVRLSVANGPGAGAEPGSEGYGLLGMRERAELIGARLTTGPAADGGWVNVLTIPIERASA